MINLEIINDLNNKFKLLKSPTKKIVSNIIFNESKYENILMSIIIVDDEYLRTLKIKYFDIDVFTDVITFNLSDNKKDLEAEIYISWDRVNDNAKKFEQQIENEIKRVIIHGCLHLVGFKDFTLEEKKDMIKKEQEYMNKDIIIQ